MSKPAKFTETLQTLEVGKVMTAEAPIKLGADKLRMKVVDRKDNDLVTLHVTFLGVHMGFLRGKPGQSGDYRFTDD
jgi:hypothetical protein